MIAGKRDVACLAAVRAIVQTVDAQFDVVLPLADGAVLLAGAIFLGLIALHADDLLPGCHSLPDEDFT